MGHTIAVSGKGGTGKTTFAALIIRLLKMEKAGSILAIDADPNSNLGEALGIRHVSTIVDIIDGISKNPAQIPKGISKDRFIDLKIQESLDEEEGFDILSMGRPEGPGCYCFANNMLRGLIEKLMNNYDYVVIDNEAGMEHLSRRLVRKINTLYIISDSSIIGVRSAARISKLVDELDIEVKERSLVLNKSKGTAQTLEAETEKSGLLVETVLPHDLEIENVAIKSGSIFDLDTKNPVMNKVKELVSQHLHAGNTK